jgi:hypothetical protein
MMGMIKRDEILVYILVALNVFLAYKVEQKIDQNTELQKRLLNNRIEIQQIYEKVNIKINEKDDKIKELECQIKKLQISSGSVYNRVSSIIDTYNKENPPISKRHLLAIIKVESQFNPKAYNRRSGASGLCQFMPSTYRMIIKKYGIVDKGIFDIESNTLAGAYYWRDLMEVYNNDVDRALSGYLGAYNTRYIRLVKESI